MRAEFPEKFAFLHPEGETVAAPCIVELPRVSEPATLADTMRDQLDFLVDVQERGLATAEQVNRICRVMRILLEPFEVKRKGDQPQTPARFS
jgi:hypothetical protein